MPNDPAPHDPYDPENEPKDQARTRQQIWESLNDHERAMLVAVGLYFDGLKSLLQNYYPPAQLKELKQGTLTESKELRLRIQSLLGAEMDDIRRDLVAYLEKATQPVPPPASQPKRHSDISDPDVPF